MHLSIPQNLNQPQYPQHLRKMMQVQSPHNSTAKHDVKNNVQPSSSFFIRENISKTEILWALQVSYKHYFYNSCSEIVSKNVC